MPFRPSTLLITVTNERSASDIGVSTAAAANSGGRSVGTDFFRMNPSSILARCNRSMVAASSASSVRNASSG